MELFLKIVSPIKSYDFNNFIHNLLLSLPASILIGIILFFTRYGNWDDLFAHQDESSATKTIG